MIFHQTQGGVKELYVGGTLALPSLCIHVAGVDGMGDRSQRRSERFVRFVQIDGQVKYVFRGRRRWRARQANNICIVRPASRRRWAPPIIPEAPITRTILDATFEVLISPDCSLSPV